MPPDSYSGWNHRIRLSDDALGSRKLMELVEAASTSTGRQTTMKYLLVSTCLALLALSPNLLMAQNHGEVGAYADYFHLSAPTPAINYVGVGGRVSLTVTPHFAMEGEMNYDFARNYTSTSSSNVGGGISSSFVKTRIRPLTGLFGPTLQVGTKGAFRAFITGKLGFINFSTRTSGAVSSSTFTGAVKGVGGGGTYFAAYPGGGVEGFLGPIGLRLDVGDEVYLNNGARNNLRVTFGPTLRF